MPYITNTDLESWLGTETLVQLTDDEETGSPNADRLTEARLGAEAEADSYLATRYLVPVDVSSEPDVAAALRRVILDLAAHRLHNRRPPVPKDIVDRRHEAVAWLAGVTDGQVRLPSTQAIPANPALGIVARTLGPPRTMTRETLDGI